MFNNIYILLIAILASFIIFLDIAWFFRIPHRDFVEDKDKVISPADGKIVVIEEVEEDEIFHETMLQISIFMSPSNVHINWYPVSGTIEYVNHHKGKYLVAWLPKSSKLNEHTTVVINTSKGKILLRQIAGFVARRIVCYAKEQSSIKQGQELGFIKFGSRVDILLPKETKPLVKTGDKVKGLQTPLAYLD